MTLDLKPKPKPLMIPAVRAWGHRHINKIKKINKLFEKQFQIKLQDC